MSLNLKQLEAFVWVSDLASFGQAAERLGTTQPNISARIAKLEESLGVTLMLRDAGSVRLTPQGQKLIGYAREVLSAVDQLITVSGQRGLYDGTLRLGVTELVSLTWLRPFLRAMKDAFPNLLVEVTVGMSIELERALAGRQLDLALQNAPFARAMSGEVFLGEYPLVWVAHPDLDVADTLENVPVLTHGRETVLYQEIAAHFAGRTAIAPRLVPSSNLFSCLQMVQDGLGVAALPAAMVPPGLRVLPYAWTPAPLTFFARYDAERAIDPVVAAGKLASEIAMQSIKSNNST
ncbi:DNA-binding transcriptional regulator, LysR family [Cognatiyoonia koreensis]|uniref:DNA-binding transcriptional regulator, LysR family n=1 Tax=Cognatiyoonia koreensis TaxID=364200 RepID=A0A1I0RJE0_9RHOB|nr:LysR family transcriptional regulator [Cognatiyoonia koreensis]SEW41062.1 DNA-binding transcriptional regulator, LysR family [Cognatiyoonia koreensis]